ncbi:MAG TPA: hypothetical protein VGF86_15485 [Candidatus Tumulicola sp.]|jgi:hypothetical protein
MADDQTTTDAPYQATAEVTIGSTDAVDSTSSAMSSDSSGTFAADSGGGAPAAGGTVTELVNLGLAVWKIMDDGTPNMVPVDQMGSGVPSDISSLSQMSDFSSDDRRLQVSYKGSTIGSEYLPGFDPTDLMVTVLWRFGGRYQGVGHYVGMANVSVTGVPGTGRHIDVTATFDKPLNVGSASDPIADLGLNLTISDTGAFHTNQQVTNLRGSLKGNGAGILGPV